MNYCGIDLAKDSSAICVVTDTGEVLDRRVVATQRADFRAALADAVPVRCVVEAGPLAESVCRDLESFGAEAHIIDPRRAKRLAEAQKKTDRRDAQTLADLCRTGFYRQVLAKSPVMREVRTQLKVRDNLRGMTTRLNAEIRGLLAANGIKVNNGSGARFEGAVVDALASASEPLRQVILPLLHLYKEAQDAKRSVQQEIERHEEANDLTMKRLCSVPQVATLTALAFKTALQDPNRFTSAREVGDYFGLAPGVYQSGNTLHLGRITCSGDALGRKQLVGAAARLLTHGPDCALRRWGLRVAHRRGRARGQVAVSRKLAVLMWNLWRRDMDFDAAL